MTHLMRHPRKIFANPFTSELVGPLSDFFDNILKDEFPEFSKKSGISIAKGSYPKINIDNYEDRFIVEAEIPGLTKEDITIKVLDGYLTINGKKKEKSNKVEHECIYRELKHSAFSRTIQLNDLVDDDNIVAKFNNGILEIILPKIKPEIIEKHEKQIAIQ